MSEQPLSIAGPLPEPQSVSLPRGMIVLWSGTASDIPNGWVLCDGDNGTPNLTDKFVLGAGGSMAASGGAASHQHTLPFTVGSSNLRSNYGPEYGTDGGAHASNVQISHSAGTGTTAHALSALASSLPPYFALCYIMKI